MTLEVEFNEESSHLRNGTHICLSSQVSVFSACSWESDFVLVIPLLKCKQVHEKINYLYGFCTIMNGFGHTAL